MGNNELSNRDNWQNESGEKALNLEKIFYQTFKTEFLKKENSYLRIREKPKEFKNIYENIDLSDITINQIYTPLINIHMDYQ